VNLVGFGAWDGYVINASFGVSTFRWINCEAYLSATSVNATSITAFAGPSASGTVIIDGGLALITDGGGGATSFRGATNSKPAPGVVVATGNLRILTPASGGADFLQLNDGPTYVGPGVVYDYAKVSGTITPLKSNVLQPTTPQRTFDVSATGEGGLDFDNMKQATAPTTMTNVTVPVVTTVGTTTNLTNLPTIPANWITAAGIEAGALNAKGDWAVAGDAMTLSAAVLAALFSDTDTTALVNAIIARVESDLDGSDLSVAAIANAAATAARDAILNRVLAGNHDVVGSLGKLAQSLPAYGTVNTTTPPTVEAIADAVLDEATSGHQTAGTAGKALTDAAAGGGGGGGVVRQITVNNRNVRVS
jgi:hypothetical protein